MKNLLDKLKKNRRAKKIFWVTLSVVFMIGLWWVLAETFFSLAEVFPSPPQVMRQMGEAAGTIVLWRSIWNSVRKVLVAFTVSFLLSFVLASLAAWREGARHFISPIVTVLRAMPTIGVVFVLFMIIRRQEAAVVTISAMMIFPTMYENFYAAIKETDSKLLEMARVHKIPFLHRLKGVYAPHMAPYVFASSVAGIGMGLKVVIAAEIISFAVVSNLGTQMWRSNLDGGGELFMWLLVAILISFLLEGIIRIAGYFAMPWKRRKGGTP